EAGHTLLCGRCAMTLWILIACMTGAALCAVLWPLRRQPTSGGEGGNDSAVYRDQLYEIERDLRAGSLGASEAQAARIEVSRRLLAAEETGAIIRDASAQMGARNPQRTRLLSGVIAAIVLTFGAAGLYVALGSPNLPGQPI